MNIRQLSLGQSTMQEMNGLREYNLFKFYNTSLKTPYSFICQNVLVVVCVVLWVQVDL